MKHLNLQSVVAEGKKAHREMKIDFDLRCTWCISIRLYIGYREVPLFREIFVTRFETLKAIAKSNAWRTRDVLIE